MCQWGNWISVKVHIPAELSATGEERWKVVDIDACIAPLVKALNDAGIHTISSCCGHGEMASHIWLDDGRILVIVDGSSSMSDVGKKDIDSKLKGLKPIWP